MASPQHLFGSLLAALLFLVLPENLQLSHGTMVSSTSRSGASTTMRMHRTQAQHKMSMALMTRRMSVKAALKKIPAEPKLVSLLEGALAAQASAGRSQAAASAGAASANKAEEMLNEMLQETQAKYDLELQKCCEYDKTQSRLIEESRQDISMFNGEAAEARKEILEAQDLIRLCEIKLPELDDSLRNHGLQCKEDRGELEGMLKIVQGDLNAMSNILQMTDCKKVLLLQRCEDEEAGCSYVTVQDDAWRSSVNMIQSTETREMLAHSLHQLYGEEEDSTTTTDAPATSWIPNVSARMTAPRSGPCKAPTPTDKRSGKCTMNDSPNCDKMQERFEYIEAGIQDKRDELMSQIAKLETDCTAVKANLDAQMSDSETRLKDQQTMLAGSTKKQNGAEEQSRLKTLELNDLNADYATMTGSCHTSYATLEGEECGLKKIRGELAKMSGTVNAFFQDCVVSEWLPGDCSATCGGGVMKMVRSVVTPPKLGAPCPLLAAQKTCNEHKCPNIARCMTGQVGAAVLPSAAAVSWNACVRHK